MTAHQHGCDVFAGLVYYFEIKQLLLSDPAGNLEITDLGETGMIRHHEMLASQVILE